MLEAKRLGKLIVAHCEDNSLLRGGYIHDGAYAKRPRPPGHLLRERVAAHRSGIWNWCGRRAAAITSATSPPRRAWTLIRKAKAEGAGRHLRDRPPLPAAVTIPCLQEDGRFKMNPPLRDPSDREALLEGLADGTIDMIATDHAPHSAEEKGQRTGEKRNGHCGTGDGVPAAVY